VANIEKKNILQVRDLVSGYGRIETLHGVSIDVPVGGITAIIGPNGSGKSSLLKSVSGLIRTWSGNVLLDGKDITNLAAHKLVSEGMTMVPQGRVVFPQLSVEENLTINAFTVKSKQVVRERLEEVYAFLPILSERRKQFAGNLSGGEQVMLSIAKVLMQKPKLLLLDEPSLGLSPKIVDFVYDRIQHLANNGVDVLVVEQNTKKALAIANHVVVLVLGDVRFEGTPDSLEKEIDLGTLFLEGRIAE
jgi:branched-chain amino acid transport system ATP-binding protein